MTTRLYATFSIDDMLFGVDATDVQEILRPQRLTKIPLAPPEVSGLMNLRGQIVVNVDIRQRLGLEPCDVDGDPLNVVLRTEHGPLSVIVDAVGDVFEADDNELTSPPETLSSPTVDLVSAVHKLDDRLLLVLDVQEAATPSTPATPATI